MAYRYGNREQLTFLPPSIEDYVGSNDPVRVYDAFVEALDFDELGIVINSDKVGNPSYNPKAMLKLLIYGPSYGIRSSRKLERATKHNLSFIWLMGGISPDHKTIAEFRKNNKQALKKVLKQCAHLCIKLGLIEGNILFVDGTKIRANASIKNSWTKERCQRALKVIDDRIEQLLDEWENADSEEENKPSLVTMNEELGNKATLKSRVEKVLKELEQSGKKSINTTDNDCVRVNSVHGSFSGYNAQVVVDEKAGFIVNTDVVNDNNDCKQFAEQINQANEVLDKKCAIACADCGYFDVPHLEEINRQNIDVIVPSRQEICKIDKPFGKDKFNYDSSNDCYRCPQDKILDYRYTDGEGKRIYGISKKECKDCKHFSECAGRTRDGRVISRLKNEELREEFEAQYKQPDSQQIYKLRQEKVELPFAHFRHNLGIRNFLLRGVDGVRAEMAVLGTCFNLTRMIGIFGVDGLIARLTG